MKESSVKFTKKNHGPRYLTLERLRIFCVLIVGIVCAANCAMTGAMTYAVVGLAARPVPVILRDADGKAMVVKSTVLPGNERPDIWKSHFAKTFVNRWVAVDSATLDEDLAEALNLMAPEWREYLVADEDRLTRRRRLGLARSNLKSRPENIQVQIADAKGNPNTYFAVVYGSMVFTPRLESLDKEKTPPETLWFYTWLRFESVPLTEINPFGYQVEAEETRWFESQRLLLAHIDLEKRS